MASKLGMISQAAVKLGEPPVLSLDEDNKAAKSGANLYDQAYESLLSYNRWRFAVAKRDPVPVVGFAAERVDLRIPVAIRPGDADADQGHPEDGLRDLREQAVL